MARGKCALGALACMLAVITAAPANAGPITFNTALPVHRGELIVREQFVWMRATDDPGPMDRELNVIAVPSVFVYGPHPRLTLFGIVPYLSKTMDLTTPTGRMSRSTKGLGDVTLLVRFTALAKNGRGRTTRLAPFAGLKLPTGTDDGNDALGRFPQPFQLGSGSWDPIIGTIFTRQTLRWEFDFSTSYQLRTEANGFDAGEEARGEASFQYRLAPWSKLGGGVPSYLFGVVETNAIWRGKDRVSGTDDPDSGGFTWYISPGLQWVTLRTVLEAAFQIPAFQNLNGNALGNDFMGRLSVRVNI